MLYGIFFAAEGVFGEEFEQQLRFRSAREMSLKNVLEVLPNPENRIALSSEKDAMGIPSRRRTMRSTSMRRGHERLQDFEQIARLMGGTNLRHSKEGVFANNQHICGTLSMGSDPARAVCDQWAAPSIMPTCSCAARACCPRPAPATRRKTAWPWPCARSSTSLTSNTPRREEAGSAACWWPTPSTGQGGIALC